MTLEQTISVRFKDLGPTFTERTRRLWAGAEAMSAGTGGGSAVSRATGISRSTVYQGIKELNNPDDFQEGSTRTRRSGGGRKKTIEVNPEVFTALDTLVEPITRGDPQSPLRWTCKSLGTLAGELNDQGHGVSRRMVRELLHEMGYSLQANRKTSEGKQHPDRNLQLEFINLLVEENLAGNNPVISVDAKKKELVRDSKNAGREWRPADAAQQVNVYVFLSAAEGRATSYGIHDVGRDEGWFNVGVDRDTAVFAVESIRRWWNTIGKQHYSHATALIITADGGGSRIRLWKTQLQDFCNEIRIPITVSHFPPGTSKWNKIEHRLFSFMNMNWRGTPLTSFQTIVNLISSTTTRSGLTVGAEIDHNTYPRGIKVSDAQMKMLAISRNEFHGEWNYTLHPQSVLPL